MATEQLIKKTPVRVAELYTRLVQEWQSTIRIEALPVGPVLIEDPQPMRFGVTFTPVHLYAIWDEWADLSQEERAELVMDSYAETHPVQDVLRVNLAMGLTVAEAQKRGLKYSL